MARTAKTTDTKKVEEKTAKPNTSSEDKVAEENKELKNRLAELEALVKKMSENVQQTPVVEPVKKEKKEKSVPFINMTAGTLVLKGSQMWTIEGQFKSRKFSEREAIIILSNMNNCIRSGKVYIADADFIQENDLYDAYQYILSDKELKTIFDREPTYIIEAYKMVADGQKQIIIDMVIDRVSKGLSVDANVLLQLGKLSGKDLLNIEPLED